ncbi:hypothetical protein KY290_014365 [Solanum tuberosum]|uniref:Uncharacterized protein n=1 Tax=Solanum tuberosum TaxID=4113 RepID=A0ABQ7VRJ9_SOLTU|nr:hypothetical protein KY289_014426 [Solanum tuberosum]KAH0699554.1 hypothetical protein KY284_013769 [Solanum tuberosum]KAH0770384.1 hypothetical protein KY290_014365 [Solanum tuberosum]
MLSSDQTFSGQASLGQVSSGQAFSVQASSGSRPPRVKQTQVRHPRIRLPQVRCSRGVGLLRSGCLEERMGSASGRGGHTRRVSCGGEASRHARHFPRVGLGVLRK